MILEIKSCARTSNCATNYLQSLPRGRERRHRRRKETSRRLKISKIILRLTNIILRNINFAFVDDREFVIKEYILLTIMKPPRMSDYDSLVDDLLRLRTACQTHFN